MSESDLDLQVKLAIYQITVATGSSALAFNA
jgi:hypothetical protein